MACNFGLLVVPGGPYRADCGLSWWLIGDTAEIRTGLTKSTDHPGVNIVGTSMVGPQKYAT